MILSADYPPRVRVEWLVAVARVVLVGGGLVAVVIDPLEPDRAWMISYLLAWYLVFSVGVLALVWTPVRFAPGWDISLHVFDLMAFTILVVTAAGAAKSSLVSLTLIFLLLSATIRWQVRGTLWTALAAALAYLTAAVYVRSALGLPFEAYGQVLVRVIYLCVVTALLGYLGAHQRRFHEEVSRLAAWPRTVSRDPNAVFAEVLTRAAECLGAPRVVLAWEDPEGDLILAWLEDGAVVSCRDPETAYGALVLPTLEGRSFLAEDARDARARVVTMTPRGFLRRQCAPIDERLRARFNMRAVQAWPLQGEVVRGRLFCLDKARMPLDDLVLGEFVARLAASRLDCLYLLERLREASAMEERLKVARDLHDTVLQAQAGVALQLVAARRLFDRDPGAARKHLEDVQAQLERGELEMRSFIRGLRPRAVRVAEGVAASLSEQLHELGQRVGRQWDVKVILDIDSSADTLAPDLSDELYRVVQEGVVNAARHADASAIRVRLALDDRCATLTIADDGKGFPSAGVYDLAALARLNQGPVTLRERVAELQGNLTLSSTRNVGTELSITVPLAHA